MSHTLPRALLLLLSPLVRGQAPPATFQATVALGSTSYTANFALHSARGPNFSIQVQQLDGSLLAHTPGPVRTYIGTISALPGAMASAVRRANGAICYHVLFEDGAEWINDGTATTLRTNSGWTPNYPSLVTGTGGAGSRIQAAEVGVDLPFSQYSVDNDVDRAIEMVEHSVNTVNLIYLRDAGIMHRLGRVVVRADAAQDPYAGMTTTNALLTELGNQWNTVLPASTHDIGLVATRATGGGLGGVGVVGSPGYSSNGASTQGDFAVVWRHEVGHNWSMGHFDGGTPEGATINSGNSLSRLSGAEQSKAIAHRAARAASLDDLGSYPVAIPPRASLDRATFAPQGGSVTIDVLGNDHDANGEAIHIVAFDAESRLGGNVTLSAGTGPNGRDQLVYSPPAVLSASADKFSYRIADTAGREGLGNVITKVTFDSDLLAQYSMNAGTGTVASDSSPRLATATLDGGPAWAAGRYGSGIAFDGVDDRLLAAPLARTTANFTITGWVLRSGPQNASAGLVFCRGGTTTTGLGFGDNNQLRYHWDGGQWQWDSGLVVPDGVWTFVALTVTPTTATIYMDAGAGLQSAVHAATHAAEAFDAELTIGRDPNSAARSFRGTLDDLRIHARTLSAAEIARAAAGLDTPADPSPAQLSTRNASSVTLGWTASPAATGHRVFFSRNYVEVRDGLPAADRGVVAINTWTTPLLGNGSWFWRVDSTDGTNQVRGPVWTFAIVPGVTPAVALHYGTGCPGSQSIVPVSTAVGLPRLGSATFAIAVDNAAPNSVGVLFFADASNAAPLGACTLLIALPEAFSYTLPTDAGGRGVVSLPVPSLQGLLGARLFAQLFVLDTGGAVLGIASATDGIHLTIGN